MTGEVFGDIYASVYDALYADKDYEAECDLVEAAFAQYGQGALESILDLGCGTGSHGLPLMRRGYDVVGVDSSLAMLDGAGAKLDAVAKEPGGGSLELLLGDVRRVELSRQFDVVLMMFAVLGYQTSLPDLKATLNNVRRHLRPGGVLVCDVWYGPAVLRSRPESREKAVVQADETVTRFADAELDVRSQVCTVHYAVSEASSHGRTVRHDECHVVRFFFPGEIELLLENAGLQLAALTAFPHLDRPVVEETWNALIVAR